MKKILLVTLLISPFFIEAGELIQGATLIEVANTNNNGPDFAIIVEGGTGTGVCSSSSNKAITFPEAKKQSDDSYKQSFAIALAAVTTGMKVRVHNFDDFDCGGANFISISK